MTKRDLQRLVRDHEAGETMHLRAEETCRGDTLDTPRDWFLRSDADAQMFVDHANRHLAWFVCAR